MIANLLEGSAKTGEILLEPLDLVGGLMDNLQVGALALTFAAEFGDNFVAHGQQLSLGIRCYSRQARTIDYLVAPCVCQHS